MGNKLGKRRPLVDERYTKPQGLYQHKDVDQRRLRKLILDGKLAPCYIGVEEAAFDLDECPICFLHYPSLNRSKCCTKGICTECFLQVKPPHSSSRPTQCPFCKTQQYAVEYRGFRTQEEKGVEQAEEQKVIEAKIRIRQQELLDEEERQIQRLGSPNEVNVVEDIQPPVSSGDDGGILVERDVGWGVQGGTPVFEHVRQRDDRVDTNRHQEQSLFLSSSDLSQREGGLAPPLSSRIATANDMVIQAGQGGTHPYMRHNRDEEFMDLEEFMVMKAIILSLQEQGMQQPAPIDSMVLVNTNAPVQYMHANGFRHRVGTGEPYIDDQTPGNSVAGDRNPYANQALHFQGVDISGNQHGGLQNVQRYRNEDYVPHGSPWPGARESTTAGECPSFWTHEDGTGSSQAVDQRSEVVEGGTSFCNNIPSGSDLPWEGEAPEIASNAEGTVEPMGTVAVPDSFEDQIILAIALSLAEAQGKSNIRANGRKD